MLQKPLRAPCEEAVIYNRARKREHELNEGYLRSEGRRKSQDLDSGLGEGKRRCGEVSNGRKTSVCAVALVDEWLGGAGGLTQKCQVSLGVVSVVRKASRLRTSRSLIFQTLRGKA